MCTLTMFLNIEIEIQYWIPEHLDSKMTQEQTKTSLCASEIKKLYRILETLKKSTRINKGIWQSD